MFYYLITLTLTKIRIFTTIFLPSYGNYYHNYENYRYYGIRTAATPVDPSCHNNSTNLEAGSKI